MGPKRTQEVREPLDAFQLDQLQRIFQLLGTPSEEQWPGLARAAHWQNNTQNVRGTPIDRGTRLEDHLKSCNAALPAEPRWRDVLDLLNKCVALPGLWMRAFCCQEARCSLVQHRLGGMSSCVVSLLFGAVTSFYCSCACVCVCVCVGAWHRSGK